MASVDFVAGWLGGAVGIIVTNPLEVWKVRLQTVRGPSSRVGAGSRPSGPSGNASSSPVNFTANTAPHDQVKRPRLGLIQILRAEGWKVAFAGAAAPIVGLAFIDSAFFGGYGMAMDFFKQDRQNPHALSTVFVCGATSGAVCALLQTPIEVVKCRAQAEGGVAPGAKPLGSYKIMRLIWRKDGLKGFYIGGLMTAMRDGVSSGIFFSTYFAFRRLVRGEPVFHAAVVDTPAPSASFVRDSVPPLGDAANAVALADDAVAHGKVEGTRSKLVELGTIAFAGGMAGSLSAVIPYPLDIVKTRMQTFNVESAAISLSDPLSPSPSLSARSVAKGLYRDSLASHRARMRSTVPYRLLSHVLDLHSAERWSLRLLGMKGFLRGLRPTFFSSFVGSAATITVYEATVSWLGGTSDGGVG